MGTGWECMEVDTQRPAVSQVQESSRPADRLEVEVMRKRREARLVWSLQRYCHGSTAGSEGKLATRPTHHDKANSTYVTNNLNLTQADKMGCAVQVIGQAHVWQDWIRGKAAAAMPGKVVFVMTSMGRWCESRCLQVRLQERGGCARQDTGIQFFQFGTEATFHPLAPLNG
jgi:hypothetical protein